ncbi:MAG: carbonic anhydrase [Roseiflexaceae bacterium]
MFHKFTHSRRRFLHLSGLAAIGITASACASPFARSEPTLTSEPAVTTPDQALQRLLEGNQRYAAAKPAYPNLTVDRRTQLAQGQHPFSIVFSCVDSRVPPELLFDRGLGDLFVIRTAGHVLDDAVLGSIEYGVAELGIPLILVLGHEKCGAVKATLEAVEHHTTAPDRIQSLVRSITPAIEQSKGQPGDALDNAVLANTTLTVGRLQATPLLADVVGKGRLKIIGGRYDLDSGTVVIAGA